MEVSRVRLTTVEVSLGFMNSSTPSPIPTMNNIRKCATGSAAISIPRAFSVEEVNRKLAPKRRRSNAAKN